MFYSVAIMSGKAYVRTTDSIEDEADNIEVLVSEGTPVIIVDDLESLSDIIGDMEVISAD